MTKLDAAEQHGGTAAHGRGDTSANPPSHMFDLAEVLERMRAAESWREGKHSAHTLLKTTDLRVVLIAMHEGDSIEEHRAPGPISIHALSGHIRVTVGNRVIDVPAGHVLTLERDAAHAVDAVAESAFLLTIAWPTEAGARR